MATAGRPLLVNGGVHCELGRTRRSRSGTAAHATGVSFGEGRFRTSPAILPLCPAGNRPRADRRGLERRWRPDVITTARRPAPFSVNAPNRGHWLTVPCCPPRAAATPTGAEVSKCWRQDPGASSTLDSYASSNDPRSLRLWNHRRCDVIRVRYRTASRKLSGTSLDRQIIYARDGR